MGVAIRLPKVGLTMQKGKVTRWLKREGEQVEKGEPVLEFMTEKVTMTVEAPESGLLSRIDVPAGVTVPVGAVLGWVGEPGEVPSASAEVAGAVPGGATRAVADRGAPAAAPATAGDREPAEPVPASPAARRLAQQLGVDLAQVRPARPGARISSEDVERYAQEVAANRRRLPLAGIRAAVAEHMMESLRSTAQLTLMREVDAGALVRLRERLLDGFLAATGLRLTYTDLLLGLLARTLPAHPRLNATLEEEAIIEHKEVHLGFAVALEEGLIVPVIHGAGDMSLGQLARCRADLAERARTGRLTPDEVVGGTFTLTNLGAAGEEAFTPILNLPQVAILGVGRIRRKPVLDGDRVVAGHRLWLSLTIDHRAVDGAIGSAFLSALEEALAEPARTLGVET